MSPWDNNRVLEAWETAAAAEPVERALRLLAAAEPGLAHEELWALSIGRRDRRLIELREQLFGDTLRGFAECPHCQDRLEYSLSAAALRTSHSGSGDQNLELESEGFRLSLRRLDSGDLAAAARCRDMDEARSVLVERCVLAATRGGSAVAIREVGEAVMARVAGMLAEADPMADLSIDLDCPCGYRWSVLFDIASFLWAEIAALARRLLREVDVLARTYGWREADILAMSAARRELYLELAL